MALVFTEGRKLPQNRSVRVVGALVASGNYATGGEIPSGLNAPGTTKAPFIANIQGKGVYDYKYDFATGKVKVFTAGVEHAAAAYNAGVTGDVITMELEYPKLG